MANLPVPEVQMALPTYDALVSPLLLLLARQAGARKLEELREELASIIALDPQERAERLPSGQQGIFDNRVGWAHDRLKRRGLSRSERRGWWVASEAGCQLAARFPNGLPPAVVAEICEVRENSRVGVEIPLDLPDAPSGAELNPEARIRAAANELRAALAEDVLRRLLDVTPLRFEEIVLDLLKRMGYGLSPDAHQHTGRTGDGGIDGIINLDKLGLQKVYVQAKRWKSNVGSPEVQGFYGALAAQHATMGVLLTTSSFTPAARETAGRFRDRLVLIDGRQLAELLIDHGAGVSDEEVIRIQRIDSDYYLQD